VPLNDAMHGYQADSGSGKFAIAVKALKDTEQLTGMLHVEARSIVSEEQNPLRVRVPDPSWISARG